MVNRAPATLPGLLLRGEGLAALVLSVWLYGRQDLSWMLFAVLLLAPDLSAIGYVAGHRLGAISYNLAHTYTAPAILGGIGLSASNDILVGVALIWAAHIGMDRTIGYGLKYPGGFTDTHLSRV